jgi:hypothetical protein
MKSRDLFDGASLGPDALKTVGRAFDEAWEEIAEDFGGDVAKAEAARLKLASALLSIADDASRDVAVLKRAALQVMVQNYTSLPIGTKMQLTMEALTETYWRRRAEEMRWLVQCVIDPLVKRELIDIAYGFERIAKMAKDQKPLGEK